MINLSEVWSHFQLVRTLVGSNPSRDGHKSITGSDSFTAKCSATGVNVTGPRK